MCGLAGIISRQPQSQIAPRLSAMTQAMLHRGPDDHGCTFRRMGQMTVGFGHRRLSIIDLSPLGHQPMSVESDAADNGDSIIYNGEIYNFKSLKHDLEAQGVRFRSASDTEVLLRGLAHWGPGMVDRLHGMFAFAYFNQKDQTVMLARDPLGIKPLYVARTPDAMIFASEVRSILASGLVDRTLDKAALASALAYGAVQASATIIRGVHEFPAGHWQLFGCDALDHGTRSPQRYWDFPQPSPSLTEDVATSQVRTTLDDAVRDHLISDVPIGVFLSSGLDSTIIAGLASKHVDRLRTFTVGFEEHSDLSESALAKVTAAAFGVQHTEINIAGADALKLVPQWLDQQDQPSLDGLNVYIISKMVRDAGITVALSGQGGDELFGGYSSFTDVPRMHRWARRTGWIPTPIRALLATVASISRSTVMRDKFDDLARCDGDFLSLYLHRRRSLSNRQMDTMGIQPQSLGLDANYLLPSMLEHVRLHESDEIWNVSQLESRLYMGNMLLRDGDSNSMAHSLEIRVPFLDRRVIDLAASIPGQMRFPNGKPKKHLLRCAFADYLRPELTAQGKRGFEIPVKRWMRGQLRDLAESAMNALKHSGAVDPRGVDDVWQTYLREPETPIWSRAWLLCSLGAYIQRHRLSS